MSQAVDAIEDKECPEGIQDKQDDNEEGVRRLLQQQFFNEVVVGDLCRKIDRVKCIHEEHKKDSDQDKLKEQYVKMAHHPVRAEIVPITDF